MEERNAAPTERSGCLPARPASAPEPDPAAAPGPAVGRSRPPVPPPLRTWRGPAPGPAAAPSRDPPGQRRARAEPLRPPPRVPLASQSAQYLLSSSRSSLARMAWCCSFCFCAFSRQERVAMVGPERGWSGAGNAPALARPREPAAASADFLNRNYLRTPPPPSPPATGTARAHTPTPATTFLIPGVTKSPPGP